MFSFCIAAPSLPAGANPARANIRVTFVRIIVILQLSGCQWAGAPVNLGECLPLPAVIASPPIEPASPARRLRRSRQTKPRIPEVYCEPAPTPSICDIIRRRTQRPGKIVVEPSAPEPVTDLLTRWRAGDRECLNQLVPLVEGELRRIAHRYMRMERRGHTLQTTALVNEAYLRLVDQAQVDWQDRAPSSWGSPPG
jgi:hypothetical protein